MSVTITSIFIVFLMIGNVGDNMMAIGTKKKTKTEAMATDQRLATILVGKTPLSM
jgi:hypothetical protein